MGDGYPSDWESLRKRVYKRDDYTCQNCGAVGGPKGRAELEAHHVVPKSDGGSHELSNLIALCSECHNAIHNDTTAPSASSNSPRGQTAASGSQSNQHGVLWWLFAVPIGVMMWLAKATFTVCAYAAVVSYILLKYTLKATVVITVYTVAATLWMVRAMTTVVFWPFKQLAS